ncbi:hypothetical protein DERF_012418 [Dermatophagoides farinae]|uniref:Uncharacterized protein n=1 Tax=Dermatophagoides farinae TaxID=6954 RepID=A0A922HTF3_DERFA|nr:hypothetical protein DERF_012418 [Dermatophagoides farinae]
MIETSISRRRVNTHTVIPRHRHNKSNKNVIHYNQWYQSIFMLIFHRCHTAHNAGNRIQVLHYSFFCSDRLVFDQSTHTCRRRADAIPCETSPLFFDLNDRIGSDGPFLTHGDIDREKAVRPEYRRRRRR